MSNNMRIYKHCSVFLMALLCSSFVHAIEPGDELAQPLPPMQPDAPMRSPMDHGPAMPQRSRPPRAPEKDDMSKVVVEKCRKPRGKFPWNFDKAKIGDIVEQISRLTCRNFILTSQVKASQEMSILSRTPVTVDQAWGAFLAALESNDLAVVQAGKFYKIVKRNDSIRQSIPLYSGGEVVPDNDAMVTYIYELKHLPKDQVLSLTKGLISRAGDVTSVGEGYLVITDSASNIRRVTHILDRIDIPGAATRIRLIDLVYADAQQMQQKLSDIFDTKSGDKNRNFAAPLRGTRPEGGNEGGGGGFAVQKIIADERTNKLIVIASERAFERIKEMVELLDVPASGLSSQGQVNVYYLKNGDAKKLATTLATLTQGKQNKNRTAPNPYGPPPVAGEGGGDVFEGEIKISPDEATNSLVIVASPRDFKAISNVIAKLDKPRIQVYVEAVIMDIAINGTSDIGLDAFGAVPGFVGGNIILSNPGGKDLAKSAITSALGVASTLPAYAGVAGLANFVSMLGFVGPTITTPGGLDTGIPKFGAVLNAIKTDANVDILSTPSLMTLDNEKAEISVGERIPVLKGISQVAGGTTGAQVGIPLQNFDYENVKLTFTITPHVNDDNQVRLEIEQDVNELGLQVEITPGNKQWRIKTKKAKTTVVARDQQTIVIGGLIGQSNGTTESKIPILGDIPLIGWAFKHQGKSTERKNLLLVLTPHVVRTEEDFHKIYERKMAEREQVAKLYFGEKRLKYDPQIDYDKKAGPLTQVLQRIDVEMNKAENGGKGAADETVIKHKGGVGAVSLPSDSVSEPGEEIPPPPPPPSQQNFPRPPPVYAPVDPNDIDDGDQGRGGVINEPLPPPPPAMMPQVEGE